MPSASPIHGALLGTIIGDALGLPYEALSARRGQRLLGPPTRHRFLFARGMMSDDGEHAAMTAAALCTSAGDPKLFQRSLAWRLRWWLLGIPAGAGSATLRAILKLWIGFPPNRSGVFSAGNGPAMRSAVLGAAIADPQQLRELVTASTRITHTDPKAFHGAMAVALAAHTAASTDGPPAFLKLLRTTLAADGAEEFINLIERAAASAAQGEPTTTFANNIGCRGAVSGYIYQTVPVAIHAWLRHPNDFAAAVTEAITCGGDTDTVAAITGAVVGCRVGPDGIPTPLKTHLLEWPRTPIWVARLADASTQAMTSHQPTKPPAVGPLVVLRNLVFACTVFAHLARRALPPY